jgi:NitT/TauT family transport system substrate-binding protein
LSRSLKVVLVLGVAAVVLGPAWLLMRDQFGPGGGGKKVVRIGHLPITDHLTVIARARTTHPRTELQLVKFSGWPEVAEALRSGSIDGAYLLAPLGIRLRQQGAPIKTVLLGHRNGSVVIVKNSPDIRQASDLRGQTIAIPSRFSTHNILIRKLLGEHKIDPDRDVKLLDMKPPEMVNALATGQIDAFIVAEPFGGQAELQQVGKVLVLSKDVWVDHICCVLHVNETLIESDPQAVQDVVSGFVEAARFIESEPAEAARLSTAYLGQKPEVIEHVLLHPKGRITFSDLTPRLPDFEATQDYLLRDGILKEGIDLPAYVDDRFARKAYEAP